MVGGGVARRTPRKGVEVDVDGVVKNGWSRPCTVQSCFQSPGLACILYFFVFSSAFCRLYPTRQASSHSPRLCIYFQFWQHQESSHSATPSRTLINPLHFPSKDFPDILLERNILEIRIKLVIEWSRGLEPARRGSTLHANMDETGHPNDYSGDLGG